MDDPSGQKPAQPIANFPFQDKKTASEALTGINRDFKEKAIAEDAAKLGFDYINIDKTPINPDLLYLITPEEALKALAIPFFRIGKKLRIAIVDPENEETKALLEKLKQSGYILNINLTSDESLKAALKLFEGKSYKPKTEVKNVIDTNALKAYEEEIKNLHLLAEKLPDYTAEEALNLINLGAVKTNASDIHFQPEEKDVLVRFRIDGILQNIFRLSHKVYDNVASQIKYKSKMKLNVKNIPQDGRYFFTVNDIDIDIRVASLPTEFGETIECRILNRSKRLLTFEELGFIEQNLEKIKQMTALSRGMILVTGPTGSGKTTTLYSLIEHYNNPERKIVTLEDPIEYYINNVTQSQIDEKKGFNFQNGLKALLRQDPDIIMIGEIRDLETAKTCAQAALTGHVVFSTLHTNSALESIPRLVNIGLPEFMIAPSLSAIIAQRLVRRICKNCSSEEKIPVAIKETLETKLSTIRETDSTLNIQIPETLPQIKGCDLCSHTGYFGQIAIVEMIIVDPAFREMILAKKSVNDLFQYSRKNRMLTMEEDGILKVLNKTTTLEEVYRVTKSL